MCFSFLCYFSHFKFIWFFFLIELTPFLHFTAASDLFWARAFSSSGHTEHSRPDKSLFLKHDTNSLVDVWEGSGSHAWSRRAYPVDFLEAGGGQSGQRFVVEL